MPFRKKEACCFSASMGFCALKNKFYKSAFTLAEVLIVLSIIGIIASITIPTLVEKTQNQEIMTQLKQDYSILQNAFESAVADNGDPTAWGLTNSTLAGSQALWNNMLAGRVKTVKLCEGVSGCIPEDASNSMQNYRQLNGTTMGALNWDNVGGNIYENAILANGSLLNIRTHSSDCSNVWGTGRYANSCARIIVDVNGFKKPNQFGVDVFQFDVTKQGVFPMGADGNDSDYSFEGRCSDSASANGVGCAAWVLINQNMDYIKCPGSLSWAGNSTCP